MPTVTLLPGRLQVRLTLAEQVGGLLRDLRVPLADVEAVAVVPDGVAALRGCRAPGLSLPGRRAVGTWRGRGRTYVSVRRGEPALDVRLRGTGWQRLLLTVESPQAVADRLRDALAADQVGA